LKIKQKCFFLNFIDIKKWKIFTFFSQIFTFSNQNVLPEKNKTDLGKLYKNKSDKEQRKIVKILNILVNIRERQFSQSLKN